MRRISSSRQYFHWPCSPGIMILRERLVTDLHVIDAGFDAGCIDCFHDLIIEMVVVHQSPSRIVQSRTLISGRTKPISRPGFPLAWSFSFLCLSPFKRKSCRRKCKDRKGSGFKDRTNLGGVYPNCSAASGSKIRRPRCFQSHRLVRARMHKGQPLSVQHLAGATCPVNSCNRLFCCFP